MINYPDIDPVALRIGAFHIHWYGLMYLFGFIGAWGLACYRVRHFSLDWSREAVENLIFYAAIGVVLGGRLGYMLFYTNGLWYKEPLSTFQIWEGGMSFHGGLVGVIFALLCFAKKTQRTFLSVTDFAAPLTPLGLGLGRLGNFINGELWGRVTSQPWGMIFPYSDDLPRHPSQLYEFALEGVLLFIVVWIYSSRPRPLGYVSALFLIGYAWCRILAECFREPDFQLGYLAFGWLTMGQLLSIPLLLIGLYLLWRKS